MLMVFVLAPVQQHAGVTFRRKRLHIAEQFGQGGIDPEGGNPGRHLAKERAPRPKTKLRQ